MVRDKTFDKLNIALNKDLVSVDFLENRVKRTNEELENALKHIEYERDMLKYIVIVFKYNKELLKPKFIRNLLTDSFAIHSRNLISFLLNGSPKEDDIVFHDFIDKSILQIRGKTKENFKSISEKANKLVAHPTYKRKYYIDIRKNGWEVEQIYNQISFKFNEFVDIYNVSTLSSKILIEKLPLYDELKDELYDDLYDGLYDKLKLKFSKKVIYKSLPLNDESNVSQLYDVVDNSDNKSKPNTEVAALVSTPLKHENIL